MELVLVTEEVPPGLRLIQQVLEGKGSLWKMLELLIFGGFAAGLTINFTHVQHLGPYQSLNVEEMPVSAQQMFCA